MTHQCKGIGCTTPIPTTQDFCSDCMSRMTQDAMDASAELPKKYPQYYKSVEHLDEIDVYAVHHLFEINDPSGALQHASKKLLLAGVRTGGKAKYHDIKEARDTLTRWLELNPETLH